MLSFKALAAIGRAGRNASGYEIVEASGLHFLDAAEAFRALLITAPEQDVAAAARRAMLCAEDMIDHWADRSAERFLAAREME